MSSRSRPRPPSRARERTCISSTTNTLVTDFEDTATGLNRPVAGTTAIPADGVWRHAAVSYDGTTWRLYLNGVLETQLAVGAFTPRFDSIQHAALGTALNSTGGVGSQTQGFFSGVMDEARIWNYARSAQQIGHGKTLEIAAATPGLLARWGLNENSGTVVGDSSGRAITGIVVGTNWAWTSRAPFTGPANVAPVAANDAVTIAENSAAIAIAVLANDTDADADSLTVTTVGVPAYGTATLNPDGTAAYTPAPNFFGGDSFTYTISDGQGGSATGTVNVTVTSANRLPVAINDSYSTNEDVTLVVDAPGLIANDTDLDNDTLSAVWVSGPSRGTLAVLNPDGSFIYTPAANYNGIDSFTYKANDGTGDSNVATVTITVTAVNDAPSAGNDTYTVNQDTPLTLAAPGVLGNDSDVDGDSLTAALGTGPLKGTLTLNANGSFTYAPNANVNGSDSFTYRASDGTLTSNLATVTITITPVNDAPVATNDGYTTAEDTPLTVVAATGVLTNDTDVDGDPLTAVLGTG